MPHERQGHDESRALSRFTRRRDASVVMLGDLSADGQSHPDAFVLDPTVEALEGPEDPVEILDVEAESVILDVDPVLPAGRFAVDPDQRLPIAPVLQGI